VVLNSQQLGAQDLLAAWDATSTGSFMPGFPTEVNDLQFFVTPTIADVTGDGRPEVLQGTATYDVQAINSAGSPAGWPKFTGGWSVASVGTGDVNGDRALDVVTVTREGWLFVWRTDGDACRQPEWPKYQLDFRNSGNYESRVRIPASCRTR
jgi:hypothetical protein